MFQKTSNFITFLLITLSLYLPAMGQETAQDTLEFEIQNPLEVTPRQYEILSISVTGLNTVRQSFVISTSGLEEGSQITFPGEDIPEAVRRLDRTGLFSDIRIIDRGRTFSGISLEIKLKEQPRLDRYSIRGVKKSHRKDLRERINLLSGFAVEKSSIVQAENVIKKFYKEKGYWNTEISVSQSQPDTVRNRVRLTFEIKPGDKYEVKDITFSGNNYYNEKTLRKKLKPLKEDRWFRIFGKKLFKKEDFEEGKQKLREFYGENGFRDFRIKSDSVYTYEYKKGKTGVRVLVDIHEGPQYKVREINWDGNTVYTDEVLTQSLGFEKGDIFNAKKFEENLNINQQSSDVTSLYHNIGYLFFQVQSQIEVVAEDSVDINLNLFEGEIATIEEVTFSGNTKTHDDVVRRTLRTVPGQKYSRAAIMRTIRELSQLGYFQPQAISPDLSPDPQNNTVDVIYSLDETQSTDNFEFSGGFGGRGIGVILSARVNFNNFSLKRAVNGKGWNPIPSGDGQRLSVGAQVTGGGFQSYTLGFQEPWLGGKPTSLGVNFSYNLFRFNTGKNELFTSSVSLGKRLKWPDDFFSQQTILSYQLFDVTGGSAFFDQGNANILSIREVIERNSVDNPINPTTGSRLQFSLEIAPPLPEFSQFYKVKWLYQNHTPLVGRLVFSNSIQYGYLGFLGGGQQSDFQRFELGGTQLQQRQSFLTDNIDLRGFPGGNDGSITPRVDGVEVGGRVFSKYTLELRYPVVSNQQLQFIPYTFFDAGNAFLDFDSFSPFDVKRATGFGARLFLPILGLIDLSYGYRLDNIPGTPVDAGEWEFLFNIGTPF